MTVDAALVAGIAGILIPLVNALLTKLTASGWLKTALAVLLAALTSVAAWAANIHGAASVKELIVTAILALVAAGGARFSWVKSFEDVIAVKTANFGLTTSGAPPANV